MIARHAIAALIVAAASAIGIETAVSQQVTSGVMPPATTGKEVYDRWCWGCHEALPGRFGMWNPPAGTYRMELRYKGTLPSDLEQRRDLQPAYIRQIVRTGVNMMPSLRKTEVSDAQLEALIEYLTRNNDKPPASTQPARQR